MKLSVRLVSLAVLLGSFFIPFFASALSIGVGVSSNGLYVGINSGSGSSVGGMSCGTSSLCGIASTFLYIINDVLVPLLFAISFIVFLYGVFKAYILSAGETEAVQEGHKLILWGLVGFVVMISLWGLVNIVSNTFGLGGYGAPPTPTSYPSS